MANAPQTASDIILSLPTRFRKEKAGDANYHTIIHFQLDGEGACEYTVIINGGEIELKEGLDGEAKCTIKAKASMYADIEWERENPQMAFMFGKVKASNVTELMQFTGMFRTVKKSFEV